MSAQVISVSRRTDIPAFHAKWFIRRLQEGFAEYRNPFNGQVHRVSLLPEDVRAFVFWTRNPSPLMLYLPELKGYGIPFYFLYTINHFPSAVEISNPPIDQAVKTFHRLSDQIGSERVRWRYDPIFFTQEMNAEFHRRNFSAIAASLAGATRECLFSFMDVYGKVKRNMAAVPVSLLPIDASHDAQRELLEDLAVIGERFGIRLLSCCEDHLVSGSIKKGRCVDPALVEKIAPSNEKLKARPTREECGCTASRDIGAYDTCPHGCLYCYANASPEVAKRRYRERKSVSTML